MLKIHTVPKANSVSSKPDAPVGIAAGLWHTQHYQLADDQSVGFLSAWDCHTPPPTSLWTSCVFPIKTDWKNISKKSKNQISKYIHMKQNISTKQPTLQHQGLSLRCKDPDYNLGTQTTKQVRCNYRSTYKYHANLLEHMFPVFTSLVCCKHAFATWIMSTKGRVLCVNGSEGVPTEKVHLVHCLLVSWRPEEHNQHKG